MIFLHIEEEYCHNPMTTLDDMYDWQNSDSFLRLRADDRWSNKFNKGSSFFIFSNRHLLLKSRDWGQVCISN